METALPRHAGFMRGLTALFVVLACLELGACSSPVSPAPVVKAGFSLPAVLVGLWHEVSVLQVSGLEARYNREDMFLRADGSADITEYEGPQRRFVGTWYLNLENVIVIESSSSSCRWTGTVDGDTMNLTCSTASRAWSLVLTKQ